VTHLYKEQLLEEEHFLDWVLKNIDTCAPERLFLWLLLVSIYWQDLTSSRRRSKRLAESLLNHAEKVRANHYVDMDHF
jgi:mediator of RNA polymerase II transcription subunit 12